MISFDSLYYSEKKRGVIICGFMVYTVKDLYVDLMWIYEDLCGFIVNLRGFICPKMDLWCTQFWADVYPSENVKKLLQNRLQCHGTDER